MVIFRLGVEEYGANYSVGDQSIIRHKTPQSEFFCISDQPACQIIPVADPKEVCTEYKAWAKMPGYIAEARKRY